MQWTIARRETAENVLAVARGDSPVRLALLGAAGVGKTSLARQFAETLSTVRPNSTVIWVSATASAKDIPFGALSHLIEVVERSDPTATLRAARAALSPHEADVLVVIDDAHLLDGHSATLVHQLVVASPAQVLLTCRAGENIPDAITALWKDEFVSRVDLAAFTQAETAQLVEDVLEALLDPDAADRIFALSQGNPLFLRHLIEGAKRHGGLVLKNGSWRFDGPISVTGELAELVDRQLSALPEAVRGVLAYLAVEEPLPASVLTSLTSAGALESAEESGAVRVNKRGAELVVYAGHPLYVERLRQSLGQVVARRLRTDVVRQVKLSGAVGVSDRLRLVALALDSDLPPPPVAVVTAAYEALYLNDLSLTERLARAAVERADSVMSRVVLAHALCWQGRGPEAEAALVALDPAAMTQVELLTWGLARSINQFWMLGQAEEAAAWVERMRAELSDAAAHAMLDGVAAQFAMNMGRLHQCLELGGRVLEADRASDEAIAWAASSAALACARSGAIDLVDSYAERCLKTRSPDGVRYTVGLAQTQAAVLQCQAFDAVDIASEYLTSAGFRQGRAQAQVVLGHAMVTQGDPAGAERVLRTAAAHYSDTGDAWQSLNLATLAIALGQQGRGPAATDAARQAQEAHDLRTALHRPELHQARAWALAATGDLAGAVAAARNGADEALATDQFAQALLTLQDGVRLGDKSGLRRLAKLVDRVDCALGPLILAHARGLADQDGDALRHTASQLEAAGMLGAATDAAAQAVTAFGAHGLERDEASARKYLARLHQRCGGLSTPAVQKVLDPTPLTGRERQIALLVADGKSNKSIAEQLSISIRTVEAHILRARGKLNLVDRASLGDVVAGDR